MAFTMHSHSGQFCPGHAKDQLEDVVKRAIELKMRAMALTEHMPRNREKDLYPEEIGEGQTIDDAIKSLYERHPTYIKEAVRLREKYKDDIKIIVGLEGEWIRPEYAEIIEEFMQDENMDFFIGSVHHMHQIPIDYDQATYRQAREIAGGTDERLFEDYYDAQYEMLKRLKPRVVGHFDLIRLLSDQPNLDPKSLEGVWWRIKRNLELIAEKGGLVEINSSALRKGLKEPYPGRSICEHFRSIGGKFTLSDDSHGVAHVGLNFARAIAQMKAIGVESLHYLERDTANSQQGEKARIVVKTASLADIGVDHYPAT